MSIPKDYQDLLEKAGFAHAATLGKSGEPQTTPVWYDWDGQHVKISLTTTRQKYRNLRRDPRVALSIQDPENPYRTLEVRGRVDAIEDDDGNAFINSLAKKYLGADEYPYDGPDDKRVVVTIVPEHTTHWG